MRNTVCEIVREAGKLMLSMSDAAVYQKEGHANFVTEADTAVQAFLMEKLQEAVPEAVFFAEEKEDNRLGDGYTFIIDPIDGTTNFFRQLHTSCISVALLYEKQPVLGVVFDPYRNELFHAEKGKGAFLNGQPIHVSEMPFENGIVNIGSSPYYPDLIEKTFEAAKLFVKNCADVRRSGSATIDICSVAAGRTDMMYEFRLSPWDYAAASFIVEEAGGKFSGFDGQEFSYEHPIPFMAASAVCFDKMKNLLDTIK